MKLIAAVLVLGMSAGSVCAQNPAIISNTNDKLNVVQQQKIADSNAALGISGGQSAKSPYNAPSSTSKSAQLKTASSKASAPKTAKAASSKQVIAVQNSPADPDSSQQQEARPISMNGKRDPFVSPVVSRAMSGSGCSAGKRCLAIDQINLRGVVKSDDGMIAVVVNALDKAYFLHENDPVFNGYVVRITGDSVVFKETVQDKLGKPFTREVTKKIFTPAV